MLGSRFLLLQNVHKVTARSGSAEGAADGLAAPVRPVRVSSSIYDEPSIADCKPAATDGHADGLRVFRALPPRVFGTGAGENVSPEEAVGACFRVSVLKPQPVRSQRRAGAVERSSGRSGVSIAEEKARPPSSPRTARGQPPLRGKGRRCWPARMRVRPARLSSGHLSGLYDSNMRS
ncbi:hypothetical protein HPB50_008176 [Hyalomma asiaticum]|uniref:Uncharacterized protein n=1 Tax=Hyalomma asiaticum TaxID=266040 RepID=A0ACB7TEZ5_HYAAI|nr:hypothetical protein HPB50_008176 [Hyalomma asiaticum]